MASFEVKTVRLRISEHPNADAIELAHVGGYVSIVPKGVYSTGDLVVYIPEQSVVPDWIISQLGLDGRLSGKNRNRVKAIKLRGVLSQGLIYPIKRVDDLSSESYGDFYVESPTLDRQYVKEGDCVAEFLGIVKYEPPIPVSMSGVLRAAFGYTIRYDIENIKKYPNAIPDGMEVAITEKIHGTWACFGYHPSVGTIVTSKGVSWNGMIFKLEEENQSNLYVRAFNDTGRDGGFNLINRYHLLTGEIIEPIYFIGEIYGKGVQDLTYGQDTVQFRGFDIYIGEPAQGRYLNFREKMELFDDLGIEMAPILYMGPFSHDIVNQYTDGLETVSGSQACIREGVVVTPTIESRDPEIGRVILKSVSADYILRKEGTEYN